MQIQTFSTDVRFDADVERNTTEKLNNNDSKPTRDNNVPSVVCS